MKKVHVLSFLAAIVIIFAACTKKTEEPCNGKGTLYLENKLDSAVAILIVQTHNTFTLEKDYMQIFDLTGNQPYEIKVTGPQYYLDTTIMILPCDNKLVIFQRYLLFLSRAMFLISW
jgi:hypothetical protein